MSTVHSDYIRPDVVPTVHPELTCDQKLEYLFHKSEQIREAVKNTNEIITELLGECEELEQVITRLTISWDKLTTELLS